MKRLSNGRSSSRKLSYEPVDEEITAQKAKFASLYENDDVEEDAEEEEEEDEEEVVRQQKHRKIWKISSIKNGVNNQHQQQQKQEKFVCSKCGKEFQSLKAKCGHMASHSEKVQSSNLVAKQKLAMDDSHSDSESGGKRMTRRSRRTRYKKHNYVAGVGSKAKVDVFRNCSSEDSGAEQELEEVAISLMMLSRDLTNWGGVNSVGDSSENNSVVLEVRLFSTKLAAEKDRFSSEYQVDATSNKYDSKKVEALQNISNFESVETEGKVLRNPRKNNFEEELKTEPHLSLKKLKRVMDAGLIRDEECYNQSARPNRDLYLKKSVLNEPYIAGYDAGNQYSISEMYQRFEHKTHIHSQSFRNFNARAEDHRNLTVASPYESGENSFETDASLNEDKGKGILKQNLSNADHKWKKGKHECPVCYKVFKSGKALGGHRRVHLAEGCEEIKSNEFATNFKLSGTQSHVFIDLNLPAPTDNDEASESMAS